MKMYTTHMPVLIRAVQVTEGPVLELGSGVFSTPLLHWLCAESGRRLVSYEDSDEFYNFARQFRSRNHRIRKVEDWDGINIEQPWDVAFIDHATDRRRVEALRLRDHARLVVLHDSETDMYRYSMVYPEYRWVYHWTFCQPWTTVVSNFEDLSRWWK